MSIPGLILAPGQMVAGLQLQEMIGSGGFSVVWQAIAPSGQEVAIKIGRVVGQRETPERLRQLRADYDKEWKALNCINSENVVHPIARGTIDDVRPYLILEYVPGTTLSEYQQALAVGLIPFDLRHVLILMLSAARAMGALHEEGVIHNDIKLSNYRVTEEGRVVLCDLGMAISVKKAQQAGSKRGFRGTPGYVPAQTVETKRKDVFGLGAALFHLLAGRRAFNPAHPLATLLFTPPPPSQVRPDRSIPPTIDRIILKAIHRDPNERYPDAVVMHAALKRAAQPIIDPIIDAEPRRPRR